MCRVLSYLGTPIPVEELLYFPDNSFIKQSYNPRYMSHLLNLAGFGLMAWDAQSYHPKLPYMYKTDKLPFYDENLKHLAVKIKPSCLLAHLRGVAYSTFNKRTIVSEQNVHPFIFEGSNIGLAHNGSLSRFDEMKPVLFQHIHNEYLTQISGTTDSEWIYALFLSQLTKAEVYTAEAIADALIKTFKVIAKVRKQLSITGTSPINLFISNGKFLAATRYTLDYGWHSMDDKHPEHHTYHSLWYTYGENYGLYDNEYRMKDGAKRSCIIIASEPLTEDTTTWVELPEYTLIIAWQENEQIKIVSKDIVL